MKKFSGFKVFAAVIALFGASSVWAVPIATSGGVDTLLAQTTLPNSGQATEQNWIASVLGVSAGDLDFTKYDDGTTGWEQVVDAAGDDLAGLFARMFGDMPGYFMVKIGNGNGTGADDSHFLYQNVNALAWAVIDLSAFGTEFSLTNINVSHTVTVGGDGDQQVPEPGTLALIGIGLLGLGAARRRKKA